MERLLELLVANLQRSNTGELVKPKLVVVNGRRFWVAPMTMIVNGVLEGSKGPLFYPVEEIGRDYDAWNGMPITNGHPLLNGQPVSGRHPAIFQRQWLGTVYNAQLLEDGRRLVAEGWFDEEATARHNRWLLQRLQEGKPIELSTGLYTDNYPAPPGSTWNGRRYDYVARNYKPDHLAVLTGQKGACSVEDGCGVCVANTTSKPATHNCGCGGGGGCKCPGCGAPVVIMPAAQQLDPTAPCGNEMSMPLMGEPAERDAYVGNPGWVKDHKKWEKAKELAAKQGRTKDYAYITGIYKKMGGMVGNSFEQALNNRRRDVAVALAMNAQVHNKWSREAIEASIAARKAKAHGRTKGPGVLGKIGQKVGSVVGKVEKGIGQAASGLGSFVKKNQLLATGVGIGAAGYLGHLYEQSSKREERRAAREAEERQRQHDERLLEKKQEHEIRMQKDHGVKPGDTSDTKLSNEDIERLYAHNSRRRHQRLRLTAARVPMGSRL